MVFAGVLIGQNTPQGGGFAGGDITAVHLEEAMQTMATGAPVDIGSSTGGQLILGGNDFGDYDYTIQNGGTFSSTTNLINSNNDKHAFMVFKGNTTLNLSYTSSRKITTCIYVDGDLTLNSTIINSGCNQTTSNLYTSDPTSFPLTGSSNITGRCGRGGRGGGNSGGAAGTTFSSSIERLGGIFTGGSGNAGGPMGTDPTTQQKIQGRPYGDDGGTNPSGSNMGLYVGGGAGNPGGPGGPVSGSGDDDPGGTGTGGTFILFVTGTLSQTGGQIICAGLNGGRARHFSGTQARGGGGSGGGRIWYKTGSGAITLTNVTGGNGGPVTSGGSAGSPGGAGAVSSFS